ncbi:MAG: ABC transporter permease [Betaproteobacteria bacterium]|nr:ABC transporter permease [Betaproteobacteria bacterium]
MALTVLLLSAVVFSLARLSGDPVLLMAPAEATAQDLDRIRARLGLDRPLLVQYWLFIKNAAAGDFGASIKWERPALELIIDRLPATLLLSATSMTLGLLIALPLGVAAAVWRDSWVDTVGKLVALVGQSMPTFWFGILLILFFALYMPIFPTSGYGTPSHIVLPTITLGAFVAAAIMRVTRSAMLDALEADYVRTARSKGAPEGRVILVHALKNASIPHPHHHRAANGRNSARRCGDGDGLLVAGDRQDRGRCRLCPRFSGGAGVSPLHGADLSRGKPDR